MCVCERERDDVMWYLIKSPCIRFIPIVTREICWGRTFYFCKRNISHSNATFSSSSHEVSFSLGLFLKFPSLLSSRSIFSQASNVTTLVFLLSSNCRSPSLPGFGEFDVNTPLSMSSEMHAICSEFMTISRIYYKFG